ncbi:hypothetical protein CR105_00520 [Massilia eurypsychrophila]|jgi:hypothetical protein|uniref:Uncharacterized protein n=1 Tax=Massilia eurypsychrophila TaxID=1485217 RepID=A0A2G8TM48_9BURK|nr:hypothetical protein [Massilia eurypsychrophila]PIL46678.1 hypothetical protein CR105_00520 [Massilia eurypsychrophila]
MLRQWIIGSLIVVFLFSMLGIALWALFLRAPNVIVDKDGRPISYSELARSIIWISVSPMDYELNGAKYQSEQELLAALKALPKKSILAIRWGVNASDADGKHATLARCEKLRLAIKSAGLPAVPEIGNERFQ